MVLDSQLQNPLGLQGQHAPAIRTVCRSLLFSSGLQIVETLVWLIWQPPSPHLKGGSPRLDDVVCGGFLQPPSNGFSNDHWALITALTP